MFREDWSSISAIVRQIKESVDMVRRAYKDQDDTQLRDVFSGALVYLEQYGRPRQTDSNADSPDCLRCISKSLETLCMCKSNSRRLMDRAWLFINRGALADDVKQSFKDMKAVHELFYVRLIFI